MSRRPPDALIYYLDANLDGPELIARLRAGAMPCEAHRDHFAPDAPDAAWIPEIAARRWVIVTRDFAIQRRPGELAAHAQQRLDNYIAKRTAPMIIYLSAYGQLRTHLGGERRGNKKQ